MPAKGSKKVGGKWVKPAVQRVAKPAPKSRKRKAARDLVPLTAYNGWQRLVMTRGVAKDLNPMGSVMQAIRNQVRAHLRKRRRVGDVGEMLQRLFDASLIHRLRPGHLANFSIEEDDIPDGATYVASDSDSDSEEEEEEEEEKEEEEKEEKEEEREGRRKRRKKEEREEGREARGREGRGREGREGRKGRRERKKGPKKKKGKGRKEGRKETTRN
eukprot:TRINITY_DN3264_c0_g2_i9.p1 TRINITY_DN3264_c0_g2~~TRINITY_DN3264_c0_g2_i9.p1  ORF type:complete len:215 (+),score=45.78 TRINITY_DN3264_c0_g2_i9:196-840(+)